MAEAPASISRPFPGIPAPSSLEAPAVVRDAYQSALDELRATERYLELRIREIDSRTASTPTGASR